MWNRVSNTRGGTNTSNSDKPVCQYFLRGTCKFGDACRNYHPIQGQSSSQSANRGQVSYMLTADSIRSDLTEGRGKPIWPLSAYGPGRDAPRQLMEGPIEQSPEELRVQYYLAKASGSTQQYEAAELAAVQQAENQVRQILNDVDGAIRYVIDGKDQHPNREDMTFSRGTQWPPKANTNTFGSSAGSAFGQPSTLGGSSTGASTFGRPSLPGATSAFGQPSTLGGQSSFGQPSTGTVPFGQPSNTNATSTFGQPSSLGSALGRPSALGGGSSAFGKPSTLGTGSGAFGQPSALGSGGSAFSQPSTLGNNASLFAGNTSTSSSFGQPSALGGSSGGFGKPSPFGAQLAAPSTTNTSAFGTSSSQASANGTPFFQKQSTITQASAFGSTTQPTALGSQQTNSFANSANKQSPFGSAITTAGTAASAQPAGPITTFRGRPVEYLRTSPDDPADDTTAPFFINDNRRKERIWMPHGAPGANPDAEGPEAAYQGDVGALLKQVFDFAQQSDLGFKDGFVPEIPPKREWISFDI